MVGTRDTSSRVRQEQTTRILMEGGLYTFPPLRLQQVPFLKTTTCIT